MRSSSDRRLLQSATLSSLLLLFSLISSQDYQQTSSTSSSHNRRRPTRPPAALAVAAIAASVQRTPTSNNKQQRLRPGEALVSELRQSKVCNIRITLTLSIYEIAWGNRLRGEGFYSNASWTLSGDARHLLETKSMRWWGRGSLGLTEMMISTRS
ncbi:hypothetical protein H5410_034939 [Solanum commersonii]|uniref:Uncharacterized protein n=1 Tax=Solanum commersonii TaxID=4109 RepID=A0A9J5XZB9_SOLCO|nr:hypothetical protein H5410_034939 [Solanum commersonii]